MHLAENALVVRGSRVSLTQDFEDGPIEVYGDDLGHFLGVVREADNGMWEVHGHVMIAEVENLTEAVSRLLDEH